MKLLLIFLCTGRLAFAASFTTVGAGDCAVDSHEFDRYENFGHDLQSCEDECALFSQCQSFQYNDDTTLCGINVDDGEVIGELTLQGWTKVAGTGGSVHPPNGVWPRAHTQCLMRVHEFTPSPTMPDCDAVPPVPAALCKSTGDPHIKTFGATNDIHPQVEGDYVLFLNHKIGVATRHARNNSPHAVAGNTAVGITGQLLGENWVEIYSKNPHVGRSENIVMLNGHHTTFTDLCVTLSAYVCQCEFIESVSDIHGNSRFILRMSNTYSVRVDFAHPSAGWMNVYITADPAEVAFNPDGGSSEVGVSGLCSVNDWSTLAYDDFRFGSHAHGAQVPTQALVCDEDPFTLDKASFCSRRRITPTQSGTNFQDVVTNCDPVIKARAETYCSVCDNVLLRADDKASCIHDACADPSSGVASARGQRSACFETIVMLTAPDLREAVCNTENKLYNAAWGVCLTAAELGMADMEFVGHGFCHDGNDKLFPQYEFDGHDSDKQCSDECNKYDECLSVNYLPMLQRCLLHVDAGVTVSALESSPHWTFEDGTGTAVGVHPVTGFLSSSSTDCYAKLPSITPSPTIYCEHGQNTLGCCPDPSAIAATASGGICSSTGDPHVYQFDQQTGHSYTDGDYLFYKNENLEIHTRHARNGVSNAVAGNVGIHITGAWLGGHQLEYHSASDFGIVRAEPELKLDGQVSTGAAVCDALIDFVCSCVWDEGNRRMRITFDEFTYFRWEQSSWGLDYGYTNVYLGTNPLDHKPTDSGMCAHGTPAATSPYAEYRLANCGEDPFSDADVMSFCGRRRAELPFEPRRRTTTDQVIANCQATQASLYLEAEQTCSICENLSQGMYDGCLADACNMHSADQARLQAQGCTITLLLTCPPAQRGLVGGPCPCPSGYRYDDITISCELDCGAAGHTPRGCCPAATVMPVSTSTCQSTGDPHLVGFDGSYNHAYTDGDYVMYEGADLKLVTRHKQHSNGVAGINAISLSGSLLGGRDFEYFAQTTSGGVRMENVYTLDGAPLSIDDICAELQDLTCKCGKPTPTSTYLIISFDEHTQIKTDLFSTSEGWMHVYLWIDPALQDPTDTGMCMYSGNEWSDQAHRNPLAYHDYRSDCGNDPFGDALRGDYCADCQGCRRRAQELRDMAIMRRSNCDATIEQEATTLCQECASEGQQAVDACLFDACTMVDISFAQAAADSCFDNTLAGCGNPQCQRDLCATKGQAYDEMSMSCMDAPEEAGGFEFMGWGYCQSADHKYYDFYHDETQPTAFNTVSTCAAKCSEIGVCQSFELIENAGDQFCFFNTDPQDRDAALDGQTVAWSYQGNYQGVHPVFTTAGDRRHHCYQKNPTPAPTPACPNTALGFSSLGCCPATVLPPASSTSHCYSWGDPHIIQFNGVQGHAYTDGDYALYKSDDLELYARHAQSGATNGVAGNNAILVTGSLLSGQTVEFHAMTTNGNVRASNEFRLDGVVKTWEELCDALEHDVCKCEFIPVVNGGGKGTFVISFDEYTQIKADVFNDAYGWMDVDLQINPTLQSVTDQGMCTSQISTASGWDVQSHRDPQAYINWRTGCNNADRFGKDPFTDPLAATYCVDCVGCRRRFELETVLRSARRRATCLVNRADAENICIQCDGTQTIKYAPCVEDACNAGSLDLARSGADACFRQKLVEEPEMPKRREMCATYKPGTQYHDRAQRCVRIPNLALAGYDFVGWGECRDSNLEEFPSYENTGTTGCEDKCNAHAECKSVVVDTRNDNCILNVDDGASALTGAGTFVPNPASTEPHPVYAASGIGGSKYCFEKIPTPAPTAACTTGRSTIHGCCPNTCPMLHGDQFCSITGDPHVKQFDGLNGDIYTNGDFRVYKNDEIEISQRSGKVGDTVTVAGNAALFVQGTILGGNSIEIVTKNSHAVGSLVDPIIANPHMIVNYNGAASSLQAICTDLIDKRLVCHCVVSARLFMLSINDKYFVRLDFWENAYGWSNLYISVNNALKSASDTGVCTRTGDRVQDGGVNNVAPYPNDRYSCATDPFTDPAKTFYCNEANSQTGRRRRLSLEEIMDGCDANLRTQADDVCGAGCDDVPDLDTANCVIDVCFAGDVSGADMQKQACKLNALAVAAPEDKAALCDSDETFSKELDACVTTAEANQILNDDGEPSVPAPSPVPAPGPTDTTNNDDDDDLEGTTLIVIAIMAVGIMVLFAMGIMIGQNCTKRKRDLQETPEVVQMTTSGLPTNAPLWKEDNGSEFISTGLGKEVSSAL